MASQAASYRLGIKQNRDKEILRTIRLENWKHRTSLRQSSDVLYEKYGCLYPNSLMFLPQKQAFLYFSCALFEVLFR